MPAFDLADYNTGGIATSYSIQENFLELSSLDGSTVHQNAYLNSTTGMNIYSAMNPGGTGMAL